jgi:hypothetical protein
MATLMEMLQHSDKGLLTVSLQQLNAVIAHDMPCSRVSVLCLHHAFISFTTTTMFCAGGSSVSRAWSR